MSIAKIAFGYYGLKEIPGEENNPEIMRMFRELGHTWVQGDETAWCAAFANICLKRAGYEHTGLLYAKSFLSLGEKIHVPYPLGFSEQFVDLAIFWRVQPWQDMDPGRFEPGHVAFYINKWNGQVWVYGGNQSNRAIISPYPRERHVEFRRIRI